MWASCWDQYSWVSAIPGNCHLYTEISKWRTIIHTTVDRVYRPVLDYVANVLRFELDSRDPSSRQKKTKQKFRAYVFSLASDEFKQEQAGNKKYLQDGTHD